MTKIIDFRPISTGAYRQQCKCYSGLNPKPLRLEIDDENDIVYCVHCGNFMSPMNALYLFVDQWDRLSREVDRVRSWTRRHWQIAHNYRPHKRAMKAIEQGIGRSNDKLPICPNCNTPFELEKVVQFVDKRWAKHLEEMKNKRCGDDNE